MTPEDHLLCVNWGDIHIHPFNAPMDGYPEILQLLKTEDPAQQRQPLAFRPDVYRATGERRSDAREMPPFGGDTMFTNRYSPTKPCRTV